MLLATFLISLSPILDINVGASAVVSNSNPIFVSGYEIGFGETSSAPYVHVAFYMKTSKQNTTRFTLTGVNYKDFGMHEYWEPLSSSITINHTSNQADSMFRIQLRSLQSFDFDKLVSLTLCIKDENNGSTYRIPIDLNKNSSSNELVSAEIINNTGTDLKVGRKYEFEAFVDTNGVSPLIDLLVNSKEQIYQWSSNVIDEGNLCRFEPTAVGVVTINCDVLYSVSTTFAENESSFYIRFPLSTGPLAIGQVSTTMSIFSEFAQPVVGRKQHYESTFRTADDFLDAIGQEFAIAVYDTTESEDIEVSFDFSRLLTYAPYFEACFLPEATSMADADFVYSFSTSSGDASIAVERMVAALNEELDYRGISADVPVVVKENGLPTASATWRINLGKTASSLPSSDIIVVNPSSSSTTSTPSKLNGNIDVFRIIDKVGILNAIPNASSQIIIEIYEAYSDPTKVDAGIMAEFLKVKSIYPDKVMKIRYYNEKGLLLNEFSITAANLTVATQIDALSVPAITYPQFVANKAGDISYQPVTFAHNGQLGGTFAIRVLGDEYFLSKINKNNKLYLYRLNYEKDQIEYISDYVMVDKYNYINFPLLSCSEYIITNTKIANAVDAYQKPPTTSGSGTNIPQTGEFQYIGLLIIIAVLFLSFVVSSLAVNKISRKLEKK